MLLFSVGPFLCLGVAVFLLRQLFVQLMGTKTGRPFLLALFALGAPLREAAHVVAAVLFFQRVEEVRFLDIHATDGELGFTERSYHPRNYFARFGNFVYALTPVMLGLFVVLGIFLVCFGGVMEAFFLELHALGDTGGLWDYLRLAVGLVPAMFTAGEVSLFAKIFGALALILLCMGIFVSLAELRDAFFGMFVYAALLTVPAGILLLFDARIQRTAMQDLRAFATGVVALYIPVLLAVALLLLGGAVFFLIRKLGAVPENGKAVAPYYDKEE
jgi:hypothetical protein